MLIFARFPYERFFFRKQRSFDPPKFEVFLTNHRSHSRLAISFSVRHCPLVMVIRSLWCSHGASISNCPRAQASMRCPPGFARSVKPFSCSTTIGRPASKAARITFFSPFEMAGDTSTAPSRPAFRKCSTCCAISSSVSLREHCTCRRHGRLSKNRLPIAENVIPAAVTWRCTRNRSGCSRFISSRRGLSCRYCFHRSSCPSCVSSRSLYPRSNTSPGCLYSPRLSRLTVAEPPSTKPFSGSFACGYACCSVVCCFVRCGSDAAFRSPAAASISRYARLQPALKPLISRPSPSGSSSFTKRMPCK